MAMAVQAMESLPAACQRDNRKFALLFHLSLPLCPRRSEQTFLFLFAWSEVRKRRKRRRKRQRRTMHQYSLQISWCYKHVQTQHHARENPTIDGNSLKQLISFVALMVWFFQLLCEQLCTSRGSIPLCVVDTSGSEVVPGDRSLQSGWGANTLSRSKAGVCQIYGVCWGESCSWAPKARAREASRGRGVFGCRGVEAVSNCTWWEAL